MYYLPGYGLCPGLQCLTWILSWGAGLKCNQKVAGYSITIMPPFHSMDVSILEDWNSGVQVKPPMSFLPQQPLGHHLEAIKSSQQAESSHVSSSLISLCPAPQVCGVFSSRVLRTTCRGKPTWKWSVLFCSPLVPPWPIIHREVLDFAIFIHKLMSSRSVIECHAGCFWSNSFLKHIILSFIFLRISCMTLMYFDHIQLPTHLPTPSESTPYFPNIS